MVVKIIGIDLKDGLKLSNIIKRAIQNASETITLLELRSDEHQENISKLPGLIINDKIISQGRVLNSRKINRLILKEEN